MGQYTSIEWCDKTFNPWRGCTKVAPECANCYADTLSKRNPSTLGVWGPNGTRVVAAESYWKQPLKWNREAAAAGERRRVFCASMADVFEDWEGRITTTERFEDGSHGAVAWYRDDIGVCTAGQTTVNHSRGERLAKLDDVRRRLFALIDATPHLDWLLLTKRPENIIRMWTCPRDETFQQTPEETKVEFVRRVVRSWHRPNVWLGASAGTQETADKAIPELLKCRDLAPVLFLSCEPLLGPVDLFVGPGELHDTLGGDRRRVWYFPPIDWIIVGGESGPGARPMHPDWARSLRDDCKVAGVPFFFKQWGEWIPTGDVLTVFLENQPPHKFFEFTDKVRMFRFGRDNTGRLLDGVKHNEFPAVLDRR